MRGYPRRSPALQPLDADQGGDRDCRDSSKHHGEHFVSPSLMALLRSSPLRHEDKIARLEQRPCCADHRIVAIE